MEMDHRRSSNPQVRKMSTGSSNRGWSEEEEKFLLQSRSQKVPYKHIAIHLQKTELACRLHFHQISHGSQRHKARALVSSVHNPSPHTDSHAVAQSKTHSSPIDSSSSCSPTTSSGNSPQSRPPTSISNASSRTSVCQQPMPSIRRNYYQHKPLLPKPVNQSPVMRSTSLGTDFRLNTTTAIHQSSEQVPIDMSRLQNHYEFRRASIWHGGDIDPTRLEKECNYRAVDNTKSPFPQDASLDGVVDPKETFKIFPTMSNSSQAGSTYSTSTIPMLSGRHFDPYSAVDRQASPDSKLSPINIHSSISAPDRLQVIEPMPALYCHPYNSQKSPEIPCCPRTFRKDFGVVSISALLTEDREPRGDGQGYQRTAMGVEVGSG